MKNVWVGALVTGFVLGGLFVTSLAAPQTAGRLKDLARRRLGANGENGPEGHDEADTEAGQRAEGHGPEALPAGELPPHIRAQQQSLHEALPPNVYGEELAAGKKPRAGRAQNLRENAYEQHGPAIQENRRAVIKEGIQGKTERKTNNLSHDKSPNSPGSHGKAKGKTGGGRQGKAKAKGGE